MTNTFSFTLTIEADADELSTSILAFELRNVANVIEAGENVQDLAFSPTCFGHHWEWAFGVRDKHIIVDGYCVRCDAAEQRNGSESCERMAFGDSAERERRLSGRKFGGDIIKEVRT